MNSALYIGRFQPPHNGHLMVIKQILEETDFLIIAIAAAQLSHTFNNPLTAGERIELLNLSMVEEGIQMDKISIIPVTDIFDNSLWVKHVQRFVPSFNVVYSNNPFTSMLFAEAGIKVMNTELFDRQKFEGTKIRRALRNSEDVSNLMNNNAYSKIREWNIQRRLESVTDNDSVRQRGSELNKGN